MITDADIVEMLKALADPNRLHLFQLLLASDRSNSELMAETGLSQNLLSHHLNVLVVAGLVTPQQSIGDARRRYFCPNLSRVRELGDHWQQRIPATLRDFPTLEQPRRVLFLCPQNAARSLMAEAIANYRAPGALIARSAGLESGAVVPSILREVLDEHGIPHESLTMQTYQVLAGIPFDYVITVCDRVHENSIPRDFALLPYLHWSIRDPMDQTNGEEQLEAMRRLYSELEQRLAFFVHQLARQEARARNVDES
jgi:protein-tyrosine-phosphatase